MPYLIDYLEQQFATFEEEPFGPVDAAVLSQVCMVRGKGVIPGLKERSSFAGVFTVLQNVLSPQERPARFRDLLRAEHFADMFTGLDPARIKNCLFALAANPRFRTMVVRDYLSLFDIEREMQFAAMTFVQERDFSVVCFRGTDSSWTGWKEDFNMAYSDVVPAQEQALRYLETVVPRLPGKLYVCGHSKGGNLAEYAALKASPAVQERIERVYILDGPGFKESVFEDADYEPVINRMCKIVPEDSLVGILLESPVPMRVVPSNAKGFEQHSVFTWEIAVCEREIEGSSPVAVEQVLGCDFTYLDELSSSAAFIRDALTEWLGNYNDAERLELVEALFRAIEVSGAEHMSDLISGGTRTAELLVGAARTLEADDRELLADAGRDFAETARTLAKRRFGKGVAAGISAGMEALKAKNEGAKLFGNAPLENEPEDRRTGDLTDGPAASNR